jgi:hypothetical protein
MDLQSQFPGRRHHQRAWLFLVPGRVVVAQQALKYGQQKGRGLTGTGLCLPRHVMAAEHMRQRQRLDGCAVCESRFIDPCHDFRAKTERRKRNVAERILRFNF